jgi:hypothetical protein
MNWSNIGNTLWTLVGTAESVAFVLAVSAFVLAWTWGKNGLKKLSKKQEALSLKVAGWAALTKLVLMAFTLTLNLIFYFKR